MKKNTMFPLSAAGEPFIVWARLECGIVYHPVYGIALDGILAGETRRLSSPSGQRPSMVDEGLAAKKPPVVDIPLTRCYRSGKKLWHWNATAGMLYDASFTPLWKASQRSPSKENASLLEEKYHNTVTGRLKDKQMFSAARSIPHHVGGVKGRYRNRRIPAQIYPAAAIAWAGIGEVERIYDIVRRVVSVGGRHTRGEGWVTQWNVQTAENDGPFHFPRMCDETEMFNHAHTHPRPDSLSSEMLTGRPLPLGCIADTDTMRNSDVSFSTIRAGLRPPVFHQANKFPLMYQNFSEQ